MKITIDNLDGLGALDYSDCVTSTGSLKVKRLLNAPSACDCVLDLSAVSLTPPVRKGRVLVTLENGTLLFTGYVTTDPEHIYVGMGLAGPVYHIGLHAISDDWLLDRASVPRSGAGLGQSAALAMTTLVSRVGVSGFSFAGAGALGDVGVYQPVDGRSWSENAGALAGGLSAAYRAVAGVVGLQPAGTVTHALSDGDGSLQLSAIHIGHKKEIANDITVSGDLEPAAYISESFAGDGTTDIFALTEPPFRHESLGSSSPFLSDSFTQGSFDSRVWVVSDPGSRFSFTSNGLSFSGGNGADGQTTLAALDDVEMGGVVVIEMGLVQLAAGSNGVLCGLYGGDVNRGNCVAGYNVRQSSGSTVIVPLVSGVETGTLYTLQNGHSYTLRVRVHCVEVQRIKQIYYAVVGGAVNSFGGGVEEAPIDIVFDLQDLGTSSNTPATILFDGTVQSSPATCTFVPVNSIQLIGSVGYCRGTQTGSVWVTKQSANGTRATQTAGIAGEGVSCTISRAGKITFLSGRVPLAGELVTAHYRSSQRSIARIEDAMSVAAETTSGISGSAQWRGKVVHPVARSSADCESAAAALLSVATDGSSGMSGVYVATNPAADVWPGDVFTITRDGETAHTIVRMVQVQDGMSVDELVTYQVTFASEWAEGLGLTTSDAVAADAVLPVVPQTAAGAVLNNLQALTLASASTTTLQVDTGVAPPSDGGFEVRRRDGGFGVGSSQDLVLRSSVRGFSIPREAQVETYYVRMYDGSKPPMYSRFSSGIFVDIPVG